MTALCPYGESGCPDNEGDFDIIMPEPMTGTSGSGYKVRVMDVSNESDMDCSDAFTLVASADAPFASEDHSLTVTSPSTGDMARAGEEYTVEVSAGFVSVEPSQLFSYRSMVVMVDISRKLICNRCS